MVLDGITEASETAVQVWPNPTTGLIHVNAETPCDVEVCNVLGQIVLQAEKTDTINLECLENGIYFLSVSDKKGKKSVIKIIKE